MKNDLIRLGCIPSKTKTLEFPSVDIVPKHLMRHFIRGYFDGDGCITTTNKGKQVSVEILGTDSMIDGFIMWTELHKNKYIFNHSDIKRAIYTGIYAMEILDKLYKNTTIYLDRKYELYSYHKSPSVKATS